MRILTRPNLGGPTRQAIALWHAHRAMGLRTLLVTGTVRTDEAPLSPAAGGVPSVAASAVTPDAEGWVEVPSLGRGFAPLGDLRTGAALRALIAAFRPDVVHTHTTKAGWLGRRAAARLGVPVIAHTFHGHVLADYFGPLVSRRLAALERRLARRTHLLFAVSDSCADELAAARVAPRGRFVVVPPAVALGPVRSRTEARALLHVPPAQFRAVCVARLVPIKRVEDFVRAVAAVPDLHGDVVGDGPLRARIEAVGSGLAGGRVLLRGAVPEVAALLPAYDALVLPSVREGCPLVAVEAFAARVPVLGYDVPGVRDVLTTWGRGILVAPSEGPAGLAAALRGLRDEPARAAEQTAASAAAAALFAPVRIAERLADAYRAARP